MGSSRTLRVALAPFLRHCPQVTTLGIRPGLEDYLPWERDLLRRADCVFFPSRRFVYALDAAGKTTFPSWASYQYRVSRLLQFSTLACLRLPLPRTRCYYGVRQKSQILRDFNLPFVAMTATTMPGGEWVVTTRAELRSRLAAFNPIIIQELLPLEHRVRLVCVNYRCLGVLENNAGDWSAPFNQVDPHHAALEQAQAATLKLVRAIHVDDIAVEWGVGAKQWWVLGMSRPPARIATPSGMVNRHDHVGRLIAAGVL